MGMSDAVWRRHANPWSGWTRLAGGLPLLALAIWSRVWLGWGALVLLALALGWIWYNPRAFAEPRSYRSWMSRGVLGEYVFLHHRALVAAHHRTAARWLSALSLPGALVLAAGLWQLRLDWVLLGIVLTGLPKLWFLDRMVWIWADWQRAGRSVLGLDLDGGSA